MTLKTSILVAAIAVADLPSTAHSAHCPHDQFWRVSLDVCVSLTSVQAEPYLHPKRRIVTRARATAPVTASMHDRPAIHDLVYWPNETATETLRERLSHPPNGLEPVDVLLSRAGALLPP